MCTSNIDISIVVIGRNEATNLPFLGEQLSELRIGKTIELVYVDSYSCDDSLAIAKSYFDVVVGLEDSVNLSSSAGRYIGTQYSIGQWILFIDGDMRLHPQFIQFLNYIELSNLQQCIVAKHCIVGSLDEMDSIQNTHCFLYFLQREYRFHITRSFAGSLLVSREHLLMCGGWNPGLFGNEELELLSRLHLNNTKLYLVDIPMVVYVKNTERLGSVLLGYFTPFGHRGKRFYGFGQILRSIDSAIQLREYFNVNPLPFLYSFAIIALLISLNWNILFYPALINLAFIIYLVCKRKGIRFLVSYLGFPIRATLGWFAYDNNFRPSVSQISKNIQSSHSSTTKSVAI